MKRFFVILLAVVCTASVFAAQEKPAGETKTAKGDKAAAPKEERWHGRIVSSNKDKSMLVVAKGSFRKSVVYNSSTKWTRGTKSADPSEFTDGADVIVLGTYDKDMNLVANRIDLRKK